MLYRGDFDRIQMDAHVASGRDGIIERQERMVEDYWSTVESEGACVGGLNV